MVWYWLISNKAVYDPERELCWHIPGGQFAGQWNKWQCVDVSTDVWIYGKHEWYFGIWQPPPEECSTAPDMPTDEEGTWY